MSAGRTSTGRTTGTYELATVGTGELARALNVSERTVRAWIAAGHIKPDERTIGGGHSRFKPSTVKKLVRELRGKAA